MSKGETNISIGGIFIIVLLIALAFTDNTGWALLKWAAKYTLYVFGGILGLLLIALLIVMVWVKWF